jgi:hypothetical protein
MVGYQPIGLSVNADVVSSFQTEVNVIDGSEEVSVDVSSFMKERAINGYCLDVGKNLQVLPHFFLKIALDHFLFVCLTFVCMHMCYCCIYILCVLPVLSLADIYMCIYICIGVE